MNKVRMTAMALLLALAIPATGCYGKFALVRKVYQFNGSFEDKFVRSIVTWVFVLVPVYSLVTLGDFVIFNVIEFWTGSNPIDTGKIKSQTDADGTTVTAERVHDADGERLVVTATRDGKLVNRSEFAKVDDAAMHVRVFDGDGRLEQERVFPASEMSAEQLAWASAQ